MEPDDVRAYAVLGYLEAQERAKELPEGHAKAYCATRSRGAAIDGIYDFWPLSRRAMRHVFAHRDPTRESTGTCLERLLRPAAQSIQQHQRDPETLVALKQQAERLNAALDALSQADRALIECLYDIDLGTDDELLRTVTAGVHRSTVSRRHHRVLSRLRSIVGMSTTNRRR